MEDILREHRQKQTIIKVLLIVATASSLIYGCRNTSANSIAKPVATASVAGK